MEGLTLKQFYWIIIILTLIMFYFLLLLFSLIFPNFKRKKKNDWDIDYTPPPPKEPRDRNAALERALDWFFEKNNIDI